MTLASSRTVPVYFLLKLHNWLYVPPVRYIIYRIFSTTICFECVFESADTYKPRHRRILRQLLFERRHATDTDIGIISKRRHVADTDDAIWKSADTQQTQTRAFSKNAYTLQTQTTLIHKIADMSQTQTDCRQPCLFNSGLSFSNINQLFNFACESRQIKWTFMDRYESYRMTHTLWVKQYESYTGLFDFWKADIPHRANNEIVK